MGRKNRESRRWIDRYVGQKLRTARVLRSMSQEKVANEIGITFQQLQKYERGTNRISASVLYELSHILQVSPSFFFDGLSESATHPLPVINKDHAQLIDLYDRAPKKLRRDFVKFLETAIDRAWERHE